MHFSDTTGGKTKRYNYLGEKLASSSAVEDGHTHNPERLFLCSRRRETCARKHTEKCSLSALWKRVNCRQTRSVPRRRLEWDSVLHEPLSSFCTSCPQRHRQLLLWTMCPRLSLGEQPRKTKIAFPLQGEVSAGRLPAHHKRRGFRKRGVPQLWHTPAMCAASAWTPLRCPAGMKGRA